MPDGSRGCGCDEEEGAVAAADASGPLRIPALPEAAPAGGRLGMLPLQEHG